MFDLLNANISYYNIENFKNDVLDFANNNKMRSFEVRYQPTIVTIQFIYETLICEVRLLLKPDPEFSAKRYYL